MPLLVGGVFHGSGHVQSFGSPAWLLVGVALLLLATVAVRPAAVLAALILVWFMADSFDVGRSPVANIKAIKHPPAARREARRPPGSRGSLPGHRRPRRN